MFEKRSLNLFHLICLAMIWSSSRAKMSITMTNIECSNFRPEIFSILSCYVNRTTQSRGTFSFEVSLTKDINEATGSYRISVKRGSSISEYFSIKFNMCKMVGTVQHNYLHKILVPELLRFSNIPLDCPFKMNTTYSVKDFNMDTKFLPSYVPEMDFISDFEMNYKKTKGIRVIIHGSLLRT